MFSKPRLKHSFRVEVLEPSFLFLLSEHRQLVFEGESYALLAPLLDGEHTLAEIVGAVSPRVALQGVYAALAMLERRGCLVEADGVGVPQDPAFWDYLTSDAGALAARLSDTRFSLRAVGDVSVPMLASAFGKAGLQVAEDGDFVVVAADDYLCPALEAINRQALESGRPWLLLKPAGTIVWIGPVFRPGGTGCWKCLEQRLSVNRQVEHYIRRHVGKDVPLKVTRASLPSSLRVGMNLAATEIAKSLAQDPARGLDGKILTLDLTSLKLEEHRLVRRPQCAACGDPGWQAGAADGRIDLEPRPKRIGAPIDRSAAVAETYERYKHHISPITGIVTFLASREISEHGPTHNYLAGHYFPMVSDDMSVLRANLFARSGGKGRTEMEARTSAVCEALERYSGIEWGDEKTVQASCDALGADAVHVRDLSLFSEAQYRDRERLNAASLSDRHYVPEKLDDAAEIAWAPAWSLTRERVRYVPAAYCYYGHLDWGQYFTRCDSNGNAAGNTREEAILQGFLEIAERDSIAMWWYNRVQRPAVDTGSFGLAYWDVMERHYRAARNRDLRALDVTADLGIPTFAVISRRLDREIEDLVIGFGSHLDPTTALRRALLEANQYLPSVRDDNPDGSTRYRLYDEETVRWWRTATLANQPYLVPDPQAPPKRLSDYRSLAGADVRDEVLTCVRLAAERGLETLVLDQTRPDIGLPVVKVMVPGMRHFWRRLGPGRLYDVPVELGWLERPMAESELNPISCFV